MAVLHIVKVRNVGDFEFDVPNRGESVTILPGKEAVVTWEAATSMFGDPTILNQPTNPQRTLTYESTRAMHNFYRGFDTETEAMRLRMGEVGADKGSWEAKRPKIEVRTVDTDELITMLIDDPTGAVANPSIVSGHAQLDTSNAAQVNATILEMQDQISRLTSVLVTLDPAKVTAAIATIDPEVEDVSAEVFNPKVSDWAHETVHAEDSTAKVAIADPVPLPADDGPQSIGQTVHSIPKRK